MAELNIERKERSAWPWLLVAALLAGLVLWLLAGDRDDGVRTGNEPFTTTPPAQTTPATGTTTP